MTEELLYKGTVLELEYAECQGKRRKRESIAPFDHFKLFYAVKEVVSEKNDIKNRKILLLSCLYGFCARLIRVVERSNARIRYHSLFLDDKSNGYSM